jgi:hypothetical protein
MEHTYINKIITKADKELSLQPVLFWEKLKRKLDYLEDNNYTARIVFDWLVRMGKINMVNYQ